MRAESGSIKSGAFDPPVPQVQMRFKDGGQAMSSAACEQAAENPTLGKEMCVSSAELRHLSARVREYPFHDRAISE